VCAAQQLPATAVPETVPAALEVMTVGEFEPDVWVPAIHAATCRGIISLEELAALPASTCGFLYTRVPGLGDRCQLCLLVPYYTERGILVAVDADQPPDAVTADIKARRSGLTRSVAR
jgi:hypothetical protein